MNCSPLTRLLLTLLIFPTSIIFSEKQKTFQPKNKFNSSSLSARPLIVIDPGHGGLDFGAKVRKPYVEEKRLALSTAIYLKSQLTRMGYRVILTRYRDNFISLQQRVNIANRAKAALFISLHFNSCKNSTAKGIEIYYNINDKLKNKTNLSKSFASDVLKTSVKQTFLESRGVKSANFIVIKETKMPAILVEGGFLTNFSDRQKLRQREFLTKLAKGIAIGSDKFIKTKIKTAPIRLAKHPVKKKRYYSPTKTMAQIRKPKLVFSS